MRKLHTKVQAVGSVYALSPCCLSCDGDLNLDHYLAQALAGNGYRLVARSA